jgi:hypothetical protein
MNAELRRYRAKGLGNFDTHYLGCQGEIAVGRHFLGGVIPTDWMLNRSLYAGDVNGYQVRTRRAPYTGFNPGDTGITIAVMLKQAMNTFHILGWINAQDGIKVGECKSNKGFQWYYVPSELLHPISTLPAINIHSIAA